MSEPPRNRTTIRCRCGSVHLEAIGAPIVSAVCYCRSCQEGSRQIEALSNGGPVCDPDGGTAYVLYRKDRVEFRKESQLLRGYKLRDESPTSRVVATCCDSPLFLEFEKGHWYSVYRTALGGRSAADRNARPHEVQARWQGSSGRRTEPRGVFPQVHDEAVCRLDRDAAPQMIHGVTGEHDKQEVGKP